MTDFFSLVLYDMNILNNIANNEVELVEELNLTSYQSNYFNNLLIKQDEFFNRVNLLKEKAGSFAIVGEDYIGLSKYAAITAPLKKALYVSFQDDGNNLTCQRMAENGLIELLNFNNNDDELNLAANPVFFTRRIFDKLNERPEIIAVIIDNYNLMIESFNRWFINKNKQFLSERDGMKSFGFNFKYEVTPIIKNFKFELSRMGISLFYLASIAQEEYSSNLVTRCDGGSAKLHLEQDINYKFLLTLSDLDLINKESFLTKNIEGLFSNETFEEFLNSRKLCIGKKFLERNYGIFDIIAQYSKFVKIAKVGGKNES